MNWYERHLKERHWLEKAIFYILLGVGSVASLAAHTFWFILWFENRASVSLLTNIVSLEAIYLAILLLIDGRSKDKQASTQAKHFQEAIDDMQKKLDKLLTS